MSDRASEFGFALHWEYGTIPGMRNARYVGLLMATLLVAGSVLIRPEPVRADNPTSLSAYWKPSISRWAETIERYATQRGIDPNFVAAIIVEESKGDPNTVSLAGAVGLMQVMPYEAGFTWRPTAAALKDPAQNLAAGTQTLSQVIRQAQGRIYLALLAYNSGWDQIYLHRPRTFARKVLDHYARSILMDAGTNLEQLRGWTLIMAAHSSAGPIQADRLRDDGEFEPLPDLDPAFNPTNAPHAVAFATIDPKYTAWWVDVWVFPTLKQPVASSDPNVEVNRRDRELHTENFH